MNMISRSQYFDAIKHRYAKESKKNKSIILDEFVENTNLNRKYVIRKLKDLCDKRKNPKKYKKKKKAIRKRRQKYGPTVIAPLRKIWDILNCPCGQRLKPMIPEMIVKLVGFEEIKITDSVKKKLLEISPVTIDRKLKPWKIKRRRKLNSQTKPSSLKYKIPVTTHNDWDVSQLGYAQIDLVVHCGETPAGEFANTLDFTDICSGWTEQEAFLGKGSRAVKAAIERIRKRLPFILLGIHSDSGAEFINQTLYNYCVAENLENHFLFFERSRPNKKNDNAFVEQKNYTHVRKIVGYRRYDTVEEVKLMNHMYRQILRKYNNFFQPQMRLKEKTRIKSKIQRKYSNPQTPYQMLLAQESVPMKKKEQLKAQYDKLNPAELKRQLDNAREKLFKLHQRMRTKVLKKIKK